MTEKKYTEAVRRSEELGDKLLKNPEGELTPALQKAYTRRRNFLRFVNVDKAWLAFLLRVHKPFMLKTASVAAAVLIAFFVLWPSAEELPELAVQEIAPAEGAVSLRLASGEMLTLDAESFANLEGALLDAAQERLSYTRAAEDISQGAKDESAAKKEVEYHEIIVPKGRTFNLELSDGSRVWLNAESSLRYPVTFSEERLVFLSGEAFFEVAQEQKRIFSVHTSQHTVQVLGTRFNVSAYESEDCVATTLVSGSVSVKLDEEEERVIAPGEQHRYNKLSHNVNIDKVNTQIYTSWIHNELYLDNTPLEDIIIRLQRRYNVAFVFADDNLRHEVFSGAVPLNENLGVILGQLSRVSSIKFSIEGDNVIIKN